MSEPTGHTNAEATQPPEIVEIEAVRAAVKKMEEATPEVVDKIVGNQQKRDAVMPAFTELTPELDPLERESYVTAATAIDDIGNKTSLDDAEASSARTALSGLNSVQQEEALNMTNLDDESKEKVLSHSQETTSEDKVKAQAEDHAIPEPEAKRMGAKIDALKELLGKKHKEAEHNIHHKDSLPHHVKEIMKEKLEEKMETFKEWLHPDEPGKEWALRAGKTVYIMFIAVVLLTIFEMSLINKAAGGK